MLSNKLKNKMVSNKLKSNRDNNFKRVHKHVFFPILFLIFILLIIDWSLEKSIEWKPDYKMIELDDIAYNQDLGEEAQRQILLQTGLNKDAVDKIYEEYEPNEALEILKEYQRNFFKVNKIECSSIGFITNEEKLKTESGFLKNGFELADIRKGDIIITKSTHSLGWRHGHAAIVIDEVRKTTLEATLWGYKISTDNISKWQTYPTIIILRLKDGSEKAQNAVEIAVDKLTGIDYGLFTGIPTKNPEKIKKTQCAHLVWYAFKNIGYDLDYDGSWLVTPKDIANSPNLEIVQVYGVNPEEIWQ